MTNCDDNNYKSMTQCEKEKENIGYYSELKVKVTMPIDELRYIPCNSMERVGNMGNNVECEDKNNIIIALFYYSLSHKLNRTIQSRR